MEGSYTVLEYVGNTGGISLFRTPRYTNQALEKILVSAFYTLLRLFVFVGPRSSCGLLAAAGLPLSVYLGLDLARRILWSVLGLPLTFSWAWQEEFLWNVLGLPVTFRNPTKV